MRAYKYILDSQLGELELNINPVGWDKAENMLKRNLKYGGVFSNYSLDALEFFGNAVPYLRQLNSIEGIGLNCTVNVHRKRRLSQSYDLVYTGILNGKSFSETDNGNGSIKLNIGESSINESLFGREGVVVNYSDMKDLDGNLLGLYVDGYVGCVVRGNEITAIGNGDFVQGEFVSAERYGIAEIIIAESGNQNLYSPMFISFDLRSKVSRGGFLYETYERQSKVKITLKGRIKATQTLLSLRMMLANKLNPPESEADPDYIDIINYEAINIPLDAGVFTSIDHSVELELSTNQCLVLYFHWNVLSGSFTVNVESMKITVETIEIPTQATISAIKPFKLFQRMIESITGTREIFESPVFDSGGKWENVLNFNGFMARQFSNEYSGYSCKFKDLFESYKILFNLGLGIDNGIVTVDDLEAFYQSDIILNIETPNKGTFVRRLDPSMFISAIEVGCSKSEYEETGGLNEYINKSYFNTPIKNSDAKLTLVPEFRFDGYGITLAIEKPASKTETTDTKFDQDNFILETKRDNTQLRSTELYLQKGRDDFDYVGGIDEIEAPINLNLTAARILRRNSEHALVGADKVGTILKFNKSEVSNSLVSKRKDEYIEVSEQADIPINTVKQARFSGYIIECGYPIDFELFATLKANKYKRVAVKNPNTGEWHYGWFLEIKQTTLTNEANIVLLEENNGVESIKATVMIHDTGALLINDNLEIITVNG